jgi:hypothetical protein
MSKWEDLNIESHIREILNEVEYHREHHFRKPFLTAYQIAIKFKQRFPSETHEIGFDVGGAGVGERNSLAQYLSGQLSQRILSGELKGIEGAFISDDNLVDISFNNNGETVVSSLTGAGWRGLSMFRIEPQNR